MKPGKETNILWIFAVLAGAFVCFYYLSGSGVSSGSSDKPEAGKVFELTGANLPAARSRVPVLVALFTESGNVHGARMARGLPSLAGEFRDTAIVAVGNLDEEPALKLKANLKELPAYVIYRNGQEVLRAAGADADISIRRLIAEQAAAR
jgi:thioredoxin-like negative regulator of GroEL